MGNFVYKYVTHPDTAPDFDNPPTFDPLLGFPNGRKERVMIATREQMDNAKLPLERRDYCAHVYLEFLECRHQKFPLVNLCGDIHHKYWDCQYDDFVLRMKEYEREKRLKERAKRIALKNKQEDLE